MHFRCENPKAGGYCFYGGRGITVCQRWRSFSAFVTDMGDRPSKKHTLDRKDPNGNYEPSNCRWLTRSDQNLAKNKRPPLDLIPLAIAVLESGYKITKRAQKRKKSR